MTGRGANKRIHYHDDIITAFKPLNEPMHRSDIIKRVYAIRQARGATLPNKFEQTVQASFEAYCGQSSLFRKPRNLDLFCWPNGKWEGTWGLNVDKAEGYVRLRDKE